MFASMLKITLLAALLLSIFFMFQSMLGTAVAIAITLVCIVLFIIGYIRER